MSNSSQNDHTLNQDHHQDSYSDDFFYYEEIKMEPKLNSLRFTFHTSPSIWSQIQPITSSNSFSSSCSSSSSTSSSNPSLTSSLSSSSTSSSNSAYRNHQIQTNLSAQAEPDSINSCKSEKLFEPKPIGKNSIHSNELHPDSWLYRLRNPLNSSNSIEEKSKEDQLIDSLLLLLADLASHN